MATEPPDPGSSAETLLGLADELYALALAEFTPARDARAKELKARDKELAAQVKALRKPSVAAWVVNLLVRREADEVAQVVAVGEALRQAQADLDAAQLRELTKQRRMLTAAVTTRARRLAREEGHKVTEAVAEQVEATLTAAMIDAECARAVRSGLLVSALAATGVGDVALADAVALPDALGFEASRRESSGEGGTGTGEGSAGQGARGRPELHVVPDPDAELKARQAAQERLEAAEAQLAEAESVREAAAAEVGELEARGLQIQGELEELRRRMDELEAQAEEVEDELGEAEDARTAAEESVAEAARERDAARGAREALGD